MAIVNVGNGSNDKLPSGVLEKLFGSALAKIKERAQENFKKELSLTGAPYLGTSKIIFTDSDGKEEPMLILKPGLWRGEFSQWNIHCEVFSDDIAKIAEEEINTTVIFQVATTIGLKISKRR